MMQILAFGYIAMSITQCLSGVMRGAGDTMTPMWISIITTVVLRVPIAYGIAFFTRSAEYPTGRPESTFISLLVSWSLGALLTAVAYRFGAWRKAFGYRRTCPAALNGIPSSGRKDPCGHIVRRCFCLAIFLYSSGCSSSSVPSA